MKKHLLILVLALSTAAHAAEKLDDVLSKMDAAAARFQGMSAQIEKTKVTVIVNDTNTQSGGIYIQKDKKGYKVMMELRDPDKESILISGDKAIIYHRKINQEEEYALGKERDLIDQFFLLGFGGGGHEMLKSYDVALGDSDGKTVKLDLKPKGTLAKNVSKVELWLSTTTWTPVRQRFTELTKDYTDVMYSNVVEGPQDSKSFVLKEEKGTKKVKPGSK